MPRRKPSPPTNTPTSTPTHASPSRELACPRCGEPLELPAPPDPGVRISMARCRAGGHRFPVEDGLVDLLPDAAPSPSRAQRAMEWEPLVRVYERGSRPLATFLLTGLRYSDEARWVDGCEPRGEGLIADVGCGTGRFARQLARRFGTGRVVGLDLSRPMLARARREAESEGLASILWVRGDAARLPFAPGSVAAINCFAALHLMPDPRAVLAGFGRALAPGASFTAFVARRTGFAPADAALRLVSRQTDVDFLDPAGLAGWLEEAGIALEAEESHGVVWLLRGRRRA
jgi:SAM-dependent methyltransferase